MKGNVIMTQKTFDSQTATFLAKLITSFPGDLTKTEMQQCIDDAGGLRDVIHFWLRPTVRSAVSEDGMKVLEWFCPREGLSFYDFELFKQRVLVAARDDAIADISLCESFDLERQMSWEEIMDEHLGGAEEAKKNALTVKQLQTYLRNQWTGKRGPLLVNGHGNIFPTLDQDGVLRALLAERRRDEWHLVHWMPVSVNCWNACSRIFRNKPKGV